VNLFRVMTALEEGNSLGNSFAKLGSDFRSREFRFLSVLEEEGEALSRLS
jgi:hypothetical protein